jgi:hypothetical protein
MNFVPSKLTYLLSIAVTWETPDGTSPDSRIPITAVIDDPTIKVGDVIYELTSSGVVAVGTATQDGSVTVSFSVDPILLIAQPNLASQAPLLLTNGPGRVGTPLPLTTQGGSGTGAVSFAVIDGTATGCMIHGNELTATGSGTCKVTATKAADADFSFALSNPLSVEMVAKSQPVPVVIQFAPSKSSLSAQSRRSLKTLAGEIKDGEVVTCTGYAVNNASLALRRAAVVAYFLLSFKSVRVSLLSVTNGHDNWATVTTAN